MRLSILLVSLVWLLKSCGSFYNTSNENRNVRSQRELSYCDFIVSNPQELRDALIISQSNSRDDTICLRSGVYEILSPLTYETANGDGGKSLRLVAVEPDVTLLGSDTQILRIDTDLDSNASTSDNNSYILIQGITFKNANSNHNGGAIYFKGFGSKIRLHNNVFDNNSSNLNGGSIYAKTSQGSIEIINNTILNSSASKGGGIYLRLDSNFAKAYVINNILWRNVALSSGADIYLSNSSGSKLRIYNNSLTLSSFLLSFVKPMSIDNLGPDTLIHKNSQINPLFQGGSYKLSANSPLIDAGLSPLIDGLYLPDVDKDLKKRVFGISVDVGAYEYVYETASNSLIENIVKEIIDIIDITNIIPGSDIVEVVNPPSPCTLFCSLKDECLKFCDGIEGCAKMCEDPGLCETICSSGDICKLCAEKEKPCGKKLVCEIPEVCKSCKKDKDKPSDDPPSPHGISQNPNPGDINCRFPPCGNSSSQDSTGNDIQTPSPAPPPSSASQPTNIFAPVSNSSSTRDPVAPPASKRESVDPSSPTPPSTNSNVINSSNSTPSTRDTSVPSSPPATK
ncbi:MAG: choice-of-anchor Q domain-containing protein [Aquificaceae bacterium]